MQNPKFILAHAGKQHSYHVAKSMDDLGILDTFYTSSYISDLKLQDYLIQKGNTYWTRRFIPGLGGRKVKSNWRFEIKEILFSKLFGKTQLTSKSVYQRDIAFDRYLSKKIKTTGSTLYWGFQGSSHDSLISARENNVTSICELSTAHVAEAKKILGEEVELNPEWADSMDNLEFPEFYESRLKEEPHLADYVVAASEFTRRSLINDGIPDNKIITLPLGFDHKRIPFNAESIQKHSPLKVLYSGTITQRKGIKYLLEALRQLNDKDIELTIIGNLQGKGKELQKYDGFFNHKPAVSQQEMFLEFQNYDVLVLPTIFEGFGLVILEAMAAGLPVITTPNSIGPELIDESKTGYIVPIRDVDAIKEALMFIKDLSADEYVEMGMNAREKALEYTWDSYRQRLEAVYNLHFKNAG